MDATMEARLIGIERQLEQQSATTARIADSLASLVRLEVQHAAMLERLADHTRIIEKQGERLATVELEMPGLKEMRKYVVMGIVTGALMIGGALLKLVVIDPQPRPPVYGETR
jgi:hypothetical protein